MFRTILAALACLKGFKILQRSITKDPQPHRLSWSDTAFSYSYIFANTAISEWVKLPDVFTCSRLREGSGRLFQRTLAGPHKQTDQSLQVVILSG